MDWLLCDALAGLSRPDGTSGYLRLSTRPIDQRPFAAVLAAHGEDDLRRDVLAGGYRLVDGPPDGRTAVTIATTGVMAPEAIAAAGDLDAEGVQATVVHVTSPDRLYRQWRSGFAVSVATGMAVRRATHLDALVPADERDRPIVSVHDAASHSLAWLGSAIGVRQYALGVDRFGESGTIAELHAVVGIDAGAIVNAALYALDGS